jgi:hypothetical protein
MSLSGSCTGATNRRIVPREKRGIESMAQSTETEAGNQFTLLCWYKSTNADVRAQNMAQSTQLLRYQYLYFCTGKASKLSTSKRRTRRERAACQRRGVQHRHPQRCRLVASCRCLCLSSRCSHRRQPPPEDGVAWVARGVCVGWWCGAAGGVECCGWCCYEQQHRCTEARARDKGGYLY